MSPEAVQDRASQVPGWQIFPCHVPLGAFDDDDERRRCGDDLVLAPHGTRAGNDAARATQNHSEEANRA